MSAREEQREELETLQVTQCTAAAWASAGRAPA